MQLHSLQREHKHKTRKRVGRGGTYAGRGVKGQKSRAGSSIRPGFRGGDNPVWKLFPKQRGATKRIEVKHRRHHLVRPKPAIVNISDIQEHFNDGEEVTKKALLKKGLIAKGVNGVKILGKGTLSKKVNFLGVSVSEVARKHIEGAGGTVK